MSAVIVNPLPERCENYLEGDGYDPTGERGGMCNGPLNEGKCRVCGMDWNEVEI